jgi:Zn-dependent M16 (insulinase) family peptidase
MLEYQQECVKSDTQKYLTLYEEKHKELLETKQKLLEVSRQAEKKTIQVDLLSDHIAKLNQRVRTFKFVSRPFAALFENMLKARELKFKMKEASKFDERRLKRKGMLGWAGIHKQ